MQDLGVVLELLNSIQFRQAGLGWVGMSEMMKRDLIDVLMVPGTRGVQGIPGFEDELRTRFFADSQATRKFNVGYREDGDYVEDIRRVVGNAAFQYKVLR